ncbi:MAG: protein kinase [Myxococcota bacterium]
MRLHEPLWTDPQHLDADRAGVQVLAPVRLGLGKLVAGTRYRIVGWLGEGGMGVVYECEHVDIERRVALKVLRKEADPSSRQARMFREEARAVSRAGRSEDGQVSNIVEIYDFGELPDGRLWFAMELLHGYSLARRLTEGPMEVASLIGMLRQLCKGLAAAHDANVIHRDIKPGNIMLVRNQGRDDVVKVVDFGVAAVLAEGGTGAEAQREGTPHYMAPEQALGERFDHRLDIYAVGAVAFHMLTGSPPFYGNDVLALLRRVCTEPPPLPSAVNPSVEIPAALEAVLMRCLEKDPEKRYEDMRELEAAICEAQISAKIVTPWDELPLPRVEPLARYEALVRNMPQPAHALRKPGRAWAWALVVALVVVVVGVMVTRSGDDSSEVEDRIAARVDAARAAAARAFYLYPPPDEPDARTAYLEVVDLEREAHTLGERALEVAGQLRREFADTLVRLGDRYWDHEGGRPFAVDYYIAALVFDPSRDHIRQRAPITPGALTELRRKAKTLDFAAVELTASELLLALAEDDEQERVRKLEEIGNKGDEHGLQTEIRILKLIEQEQANVEARVAARPKRGGRRSEPSSLSGKPTLPEPTPADPLGAVGEGSDEVAEHEVKRSAELVQRGLSSLRSGKRARAETLFHRALDQDHRSHRALDGLSQVAFARGNYQQAVSYGKRAVDLAGNRGSYRIHLGDAYFKVFRYQEAKAQYRRAQALGHRDAGARLEKVRSKLGR